jgi:hypothetical protein
MTDVLTASAPEPQPAPNRRNIVVAAAVTVLVVLGLSLLARRFVRGGGARRAITELAEEGAVKLADALIDEVLPAA